MKAILTVGVSASGKSQWAREQSNYIQIESDECREQFLLTRTHLKYNPIYSNMWTAYDFKWENDVKQIFDAKLNEVIKHKCDVIISNTNLNPVARNDLIQLFEDNGYEVELKYFPVDYKEAIERDKRRQHSVGSVIINKQWYQWLQLPRDKTGIPIYVKDTSKPKTILSDIDGTIARRVSRHPYDWDNVITDEPVDEVVNLINVYGSMGYKIIFLSGRDEICRNDTHAWLTKYINHTFDLYMRPHKSLEADRKIKSDIFWSLADDYNIEFVIDDRHEVCRLWEDINVKLLNVGSFYNVF